jgi:hypothetical protein
MYSQISATFDCWNLLKINALRLVHRTSILVHPLIFPFQPKNYPIQLLLFF